MQKHRFLLTDTYIKADNFGNFKCVISCQKRKIGINRFKAALSTRNGTVTPDFGQYGRTCSHVVRSAPCVSRFLVHSGVNDPKSLKMFALG
jgi:hypothetical protein